MRKGSNIFNFIVGSMIIFVGIAFLANSASKPSLSALGLLLSPLIAAYLSSRNEGKPKKYYGGIVAVFVICTVFGMGSYIAGTDVGEELTSGRNITAETPKTAAAGDESKEESLQEQEKEREKVVNSEAQVHFINTGNSDSILIKVADKAVLIDGGDNDDESLVPSYIKQQGVTTLDYLIGTHPDADHMGGLDGVVKSLDVKQVFVSNRSADTKTYRDFITALADRGLSPSVPLEESEFQLAAGSYIKFFNSNGGEDSNESSIVTLFVNGNDKFLFMGDAGESTEDEIESSLPDVDVVKIGHHGSKSSTSTAFLDRIKPEYAVLLVGEDNKYGQVKCQGDKGP